MKYSYVMKYKGVYECVCLIGGCGIILRNIHRTTWWVVEHINVLLYLIRRNHSMKLKQAKKRSKEEENERETTFVGD